MAQQRSCSRRKMVTSRYENRLNHKSRMSALNTSIMMRLTPINRTDRSPRGSTRRVTDGADAPPRRGRTSLQALHKIRRRQEERPLITSGDCSGCGYFSVILPAKSSWPRAGLYGSLGPCDSLTISNLLRLFIGIYICTCVGACGAPLIESICFCCNCFCNSTIVSNKICIIPWLP